MTWQGAGGPGGSPNAGDGPGDPDDATRTDWDFAPPRTGALPGEGSDPTVPAAPPAPPAPGTATAPTMLPPAAPSPSPLTSAPGTWPASSGAINGASGGWTAPPTAVDPLAVPGAPGLLYASAFPRVIAYLIDAVLVIIVATIIALPFQSADSGSLLRDSTAGDLSGRVSTFGISTVIRVLVDAAYFILLWASAGRATLGMRVLRLQIGSAADGHRIALGTAARRWLAFGSWVALLGFIPALAVLTSLGVFVWQVILLVTTAGDRRKQGLHDKFAGTAMVRPLDAGSGGVILGCLLIGAAIVFLSILSLIYLGGQVSSILSEVGGSV